ncbi:MAG: O-antigen ligase family protein [Cyanobacteria bacterium P01_E01_bin.34]
MTKLSSPSSMRTLPMGGHIRLLGLPFALPQLTIEEWFASVNIVALPVWWIAGLLYYLPLLLLVAVLGRELWTTKKIQLSCPQLAVLFLLGFGCYQVGHLLVISADLSNIVRAIVTTFIPAGWIWYIQSRAVRLRLPVVAAALSLLMLEMLVLVTLLELPTARQVFWPPSIPTLYALALGKTSEINASFYLVPYWPHGNGRLLRYVLYFIYPELLGLMSGAFACIALDLRPIDLRTAVWKWSMFALALLFIVLSGTRIVMAAMLPLLGLRWLWSNWHRHSFRTLAFTGAAIMAFGFLVLPIGHEFLASHVTGALTSANEFRADSSSLRGEIYRQTWMAFVDNPIWGYAVKGESVDPYISFAVLGSHSFILGNLLYTNGLAGSTLFVGFWALMLRWLYLTSAMQPASPLCICGLYSLASITMSAVFDEPLASFFLILFISVGRQYSPNLSPVDSFADSPLLPAR